MTAREHARMASELLEGFESASLRLEELTPDERLQMQVTGGFTRTNANLEWTARLATAHALTAQALYATGEA